MKKLKSIIFVLFATICLASCTEWLDLKPFDQILDDELYSTEDGVNKALNGIYLQMASADLYGKNLSFYTVELLGQRYIFKQHLAISNQELSHLPYFEYFADNSTARVREHLDYIFSTAYNVIRDINYFIDKMEKSSNVVTDEKKNILLGEAYALRAFLHFDMLRFYGYPPVLNNKEKGVPYYTEPTNDWLPVLQNGQVLELVLKDIQTALSHLDDDAIITQGVTLKDAGEDFYNVYRNRRLNYFAVQALKARVLLYSGDAANVATAGQIAEELINTEEFHAAFPWNSKASDLINSCEVMFGIHVASMYDSWKVWFNTSAVLDFNVLPTPVATLQYMYNTGTNSYTSTNDRRKELWPEMSQFDQLHLSSKFAESTSTETALVNIRHFQPLIRKSEVYLIAAEVLQKSQYVDSIRLNRGMVSLDESDNTIGYDLQEQICKEYMKDFVSEGQLFYYYKRRAETKIWGISMGSSEPVVGFKDVPNPGVSYVLPMPRKETEQ